MLEDYRTIVRLRVPFADIDMMRHVNNAVYARWAELARSEYFVEVVKGDIGGTQGMILARLEIDFRRQIAYRERIAIGCRVSRVGTKSFDFTAEVWSEEHGECCAHMVSKMVAMNYERNESIPIPAEWRERIAAHERIEAVNR